MNARVQFVDAKTFYVHIGCPCDRSHMTNVATGKAAYNHEVVLGGEDVDLKCECGKTYKIHPQQNHFHLSEIY